MGELQAIVEFHVELHKFINIDLFQRGYYQLRVSQRIESKCLHKIEASRGSKKRRGKTSRDLLTRTRSDLSQQSNQIVLPAGRWNRHTLMSPCFQIVYKNEEVPLNELLRFKCHLLVQAGDCLAAITNSNFWLDIQLCFADCTHPPNSAQELQVVHTRSLQLHLDLCRGLHYHLPIMFDYFHLSSVTLSVHGSLTTLCLPYLSANALSSPQLETQQHESCSSSDTPVDPSQSKASPETGPKSRGVDSKRPPLIPLIGYDHLLFGCSFAQLDAQLQDSSQSNVIILRQRRSQLLHWQLCSLLCISLQSVRRKLHEFVKMLPPWQQNKHRKRVFGRLRLQSLSQLAQDCYRSCLENGPRAGNCDLLAFQNAHFAKRVQPTCELRLTSRTSNGLSVDTDATNVLQPEDYAARVGADLAYLCGCLIVMWQLLVRLVSHNERIAAHLAKVHHLHRCKRFSEAFLVKERTRNQMCAIYTSDQVAQVAELAEQLRKSEYLERLPRCAVECVTVDGDQSTLPIIFEERYQSTDLPVHDHSSLGLLDRAGASNDCDHHAKTVSSKNHNQQDNDKSSTATVHALQRKQIRRSMSDLSSSSSTGSNHTSSSGCCSSTGSATTARQLPFKFFSKKLGKTNSTLQKSWANKRKSLVEPLSSSPSSSSSLCNSVSSSLPIPSGPDGASNLINTSKELNSILTHKLLGVASDSEERSHSPQTLIRQLSTCSDRLISFRHYNNVRGELDEAKLLAANGCNRSLVHIVETVSLQNIKSGEDLQLIWSGSKRSSDSKPIDEGQAILNASESLPDLSVQRLQKNIRRLSRGGKRHTLSRIRLRSNDHPEKRRVKAIGRKWRESYSASPTNGQKHEMSNSSWNSIKDGATKMGKVTNKRKVRSAPADKLRLHFGSKSKENAGLVDQGKRSTCSPTIKAIFHMDRVDLDHDTCEVSSESQSDQSDYDDLPVFDDSDEDENEEGEGEGRSKRSAAIDLDNEKCTILDMFKLDACLLCGQISCDCGQNFEFTTGLKRLSMITNDLVSFVRAKEEFRQQLKLTSKGWNIYSDFSSLASRMPYFQLEPEIRALNSDGVHLVVCVHGLDGNCADLRLVKTYLELGLPTTNFDFLMSESNQGETFDRFEMMTQRLVNELTAHIQHQSIVPKKISFIGHSLGTIIIRAALARDEMEPYLDRLHCFLSLSGPHLGTAYNNNGLVNMGLWFMQKWKRSSSLQQLCMKDHQDPEQTFLFQLSQSCFLHRFRFVLLCGSSQDHYVPRHSAHVQLCEQAASDRSRFGVLYRQMQRNILDPIQQSARCEMIRFDVWHAGSGPASALIGRAAHIAVLDSELFIEKFMAVAALKYFS